MSGSRARFLTLLALAGMVLPLLAASPALAQSSRSDVILELQLRGAVASGGLAEGRIELHNTGETFATVHLPDSCRVGGRVHQGFVEMRTFLATCAPGNYLLEPGERIEIAPFSFEASDSSGKPLPPGFYRLTAAINGTSLAGTSLLQVAEPTPDLRGRFVSPSELEAGGRHTFTIEIENIGRGDSNEFAVALYATRDSVTTLGYGSELHVQHLPVLRAGERRNHTFEAEIPREWGAWTFLAWVDRFSESGDPNLSNNRLHQRVRVVGLPDLTVEPAFPASTRPSREVPVQVRNLGDRVLEDVPVYAFGVPNGEIVWRTRAPILEPAQHDSRGVLVPGPAARVVLEIPDSYRGSEVEIVVDPDREFLDSNRSNNRMRVSLGATEDPREDDSLIPPPDRERVGGGVDAAIFVARQGSGGDDGLLVYVVAHAIGDDVRGAVVASLHANGEPLTPPAPVAGAVTGIPAGESRTWMARVAYTGGDLRLHAQIALPGGGAVNASLDLPVPSGSQASFVIESVEAQPDGSVRVVALVTTPGLPAAGPASLRFLDSRHGTVRLTATSTTDAVGPGVASRIHFTAFPNLLTARAMMEAPILVEVGGASAVTTLSTVAPAPGPIDESSFEADPDEDSTAIAAAQEPGGGDNGLGQVAVAGAIVAGGVFAVGAGFLVGNESARLRAFGLLAPLYSRFAKDDVLEHDTRSRIHALVAEHPGVHYSAIKRELNLANGALTHHLRMLEQHGVIVHKPRAGRAHFYPRGPRLPDDPDPVNDFQGRILALLAREPGLPQADLARRLGGSKQLVSYHVKRLERAGRLDARSEGRVRRLFVAEPRGEAGREPSGFGVGSEPGGGPANGVLPRDRVRK